MAAIARNWSVVAPDTVKYYLERCTQFDQPEKRCNSYNCCTNLSQTWTYVRANCSPEIFNLMNSGALIVNYEGHANETQFTHERLIEDSQYHSDILSLTNKEKPFIFMGYGCWISNFDRRCEPQRYIQDAIGEKFVTSPSGAACACFASGCAESIEGNFQLNVFVGEAIFTNLVGFDPHGNPLVARILIGEAAMTALLRQGNTDFIQRYILFGDPAMVVDMGPPLISVSVGDSLIDETYVFRGETFDTLEVSATLKDEEAIVAIEVEIDDGTTAVTVPQDDYSVVALTDTSLLRSRSYRLDYDHVPSLGRYEVRIACTDYAGKSSSFSIGFDTGSAIFMHGSEPLEEGEAIAVGEKIRIAISRPIAVEPEEIAVLVDSISASTFGDFDLVMKDSEGKEWEVSFTPHLESGDHVVKVNVQGFIAQRSFQYPPASVEFYADRKHLNDGDYLSRFPHFTVVIKSVVELKPGDSGSC